MLDLLDEESRFPKGTDKTLLEKLHGAHKVGGASWEGQGTTRYIWSTVCVSHM